MLVRRVPQKEFRALSEQNVELLVWCVAMLALSGSLPRMSVSASGRRVWVEEKPLFLGGWLSFLDHLL